MLVRKYVRILNDAASDYTKESINFQCGFTFHYLDNAYAVSHHFHGCYSFRGICNYIRMVSSIYFPNDSTMPTISTTWPIVSSRINYNYVYG